MAIKKEMLKFLYQMFLFFSIQKLTLKNDWNNCVAGKQSLKKIWKTLKLMFSTSERSKFKYLSLCECAAVKMKTFSIKQIKNANDFIEII